MAVKAKPDAFALIGLEPKAVDITGDAKYATAYPANLYMESAYYLAGV